MTNRETLTGDGPGSLSEALDFDCPILLSSEGAIGETPRFLRAPECYDPAPDDTDAGGGWTLITSGLTGQYGYHGPWLHDSEIIAGGIATHILDHAAENGGGYYVAVYASYPSNETDDYGESCEDIIEGWAIAYRPVDH